MERSINIFGASFVMLFVRPTFFVHFVLVSVRKAYSLASTICDPTVSGILDYAAEADVRKMTWIAQATQTAVHMQTIHTQQK